MKRRIPDPPAEFAGTFITDPDALRPYAGASGILSASPAAVAVPAGAADVAALVGWAARHRIPLVPRGAGTGMPGGNVGPGVVVDLVQGFRAVGPIDPERRLARVLPGATRAELNAACAPFGLHLPVDPSSGERCTIGGMIANNAAGAHSVRYGATRPWVEALDLVLADGTTARVQRGVPPESPRLRAILDAVDAELRPELSSIEAGWPAVRKNSSGYAVLDFLRSGDAVDLIVGSEGTLAIVVAADVRLAPVPRHRGVALLEFTSLEAAGEATALLLPVGPATCEMLDRTFLDMVHRNGARTAFPLSRELEAVLLVEMEGDSPEQVREGLEAVGAAVHGRASRLSTAVDPDEQRRFWEIRHAASPIIAALADRRVSMQFIEDGVVPVERLAEYVRLLRTVLREHRLPAVIFGHAGDGNLHVNPLVDVSTPGWRQEIETVLSRIAVGVARLGGTLAGEHGDGRLRAPLLETIWGAPMVRRFRFVKRAFDPAGILNPGVKIPLPGQRPLDALRPYPGAAA